MWLYQLLQKTRLGRFTSVWNDQDCIRFKVFGVTVAKERKTQSAYCEDSKDRTYRVELSLNDNATVVFPRCGISRDENGTIVLTPIKE